MKSSAPVISIIVPSYNGLVYLRDLLPSLFDQSTQTLYQVVIADNNSVDGTKQFLADHYPDVMLISLEKNYGFAEANNIAIEKILHEKPSTEYILFLNNDTIVSRNLLEILEEGMQKYPQAASVQTKVVSMDMKYIDSVGLRIDESFAAYNIGHGKSDTGQYDNSREIFGTTGSAMMVRRGALEAIRIGSRSYFDPAYFAYNEDVDMAFRLRLQGWTSWYTSGGFVRHIHSATGKNQSAFKSFHVHRNTIFNIIKNSPRWSFVRGLRLFILRYFKLWDDHYVPSEPAYKLSKNIGMYAMVGIVARSWLSVLWHLPYIIRMRYKIQRKRRIEPRQLHQWFIHKD